MPIGGGKFELEKTWRSTGVGTQTFNAPGTVTIPYGKQNMYVTGKGQDGVASSGATFSPGTGASYNPPTANYNASTLAGYTPGTQYYSPGNFASTTPGTGAGYNPPGTNYTTVPGTSNYNIACLLCYVSYSWIIDNGFSPPNSSYQTYAFPPTPYNTFYAYNGYGYYAYPMYVKGPACCEYYAISLNFISNYSFVAGSNPPYVYASGTNPGTQNYNPATTNYNPPTSPYNSPIANYNPSTFATNTPGTAVSYNPPTALTYNPAYTGGTASALGITMPGGVAGPASVVSETEISYYSYPDGSSYPVTVPSGGYVQIKSN